MMKVYIIIKYLSFIKLTLILYQCISLVSKFEWTNLFQHVCSCL